MSCVDGLLAGSFLMLTMVTPTQMSPARQRTQVYVWTAVIMIIFSILVSLFRLKNKGETVRCAHRSSIHSLNEYRLSL